MANTQITERIKKIKANGGFTYTTLTHHKLKPFKYLRLVKRLKNPNAGVFYVLLDQPDIQHRQILAQTKDEDEAHKLYSKALSESV